MYGMWLAVGTPISLLYPLYCLNLSPLALMKHHYYHLG